MLQDIAILTGATVISSDYGLELHNTSMEHLGTARQVKAGKETTIIVDGGGAPEAIKERTQMIRNEFERSTSESMTVRSCRSVWPVWPAVLL